MLSNADTPPHPHTHTYTHTHTHNLFHHLSSFTACSEVQRKHSCANKGIHTYRDIYTHRQTHTHTHTHTTSFTIFPLSLHVQKYKESIAVQIKGFTHIETYTLIDKRTHTHTHTRPLSPSFLFHCMCRSTKKA